MHISYVFKRFCRLRFAIFSKPRVNYNNYTIGHLQMFLVSSSPPPQIVFSEHKQNHIIYTYIRVRIVMLSKQVSLRSAPRNLNKTRVFRALLFQHHPHCYSIIKRVSVMLNKLYCFATALPKANDSNSRQNVQ